MDQGEAVGNTECDQVIGRILLWVPPSAPGRSRRAGGPPPPRLQGVFKPGPRRDGVRVDRPVTADPSFG
ncbi:hypothetical protein HDA32_000862 [Spinactinospora alkalitolerans]|uniref:Uncharacterized protein n=1 Tax=Spinactinospora alkalitolerans TaxID=687207 RepID=A0A852TSA6_9ACTN|nr:hypothetical protein [Spinactinospora alkalitolerans]